MLLGQNWRGRRWLCVDPPPAAQQGGLQGMTKGMRWRWVGRRRMRLEAQQVETACHLGFVLWSDTTTCAPPTSSRSCPNVTASLPALIVRFVNNEATFGEHTTKQRHSAGETVTIPQGLKMGCRKSRRTELLQLTYLFLVRIYRNSTTCIQY